jgi:hypothetical protein
MNRLGLTKRSTAQLPVCFHRLHRHSRVHHAHRISLAITLKDIAAIGADLKQVVTFSKLPMGILCEKTEADQNKAAVRTSTLTRTG